MKRKKLNPFVWEINKLEFRFQKQVKKIKKATNAPGHNPARCGTQKATIQYIKFGAIWCFCALVALNQFQEWTQVLNPFICSIHLQCQLLFR